MMVRRYTSSHKYHKPISDSHNKCQQWHPAKNVISIIIQQNWVWTYLFIFPSQRVHIREFPICLWERENLYYNIIILVTSPVLPWAAAGPTAAVAAAQSGYNPAAYHAAVQCLYASKVLQQVSITIPYYLIYTVCSFCYPIIVYYYW